MTRAAKGRTAWPAVLGLAAVLMAAALPAPATASAPNPSCVETRVTGSNPEVAEGVGVERTLNPNAYFLYDKLSRLVTANLYADISGGGTATQQGYTYDNYANLTAVTGAGGLSIPASPATNRPTGAVSYDTAGNLTSWNGNLYDVDPFGLTWRYKPANQTVEYVHLYTADDERLWTFSPGNPSRWTLRDLDGRVLREFSHDAGTWSVQKDYVYRGTTLVAAVQPNGQTYHLHPDHLGTPRLITDAFKGRVAYHVYYPYGSELSPINQDGERMKFTGHERDLGVLTSAADDLDYMHARFYNPQFMSVDPGRDWDPARPQAWNLYSYARNNPIINVDPDGRAADVFVDIGFIAYDLFDIGRSLVKGEGVSGTQWAAPGADVFGAVIPVATGGGLAVRAAAKADDVASAARVSRAGGSILRGASEAAFRAADDVGSFVPKNKHLLGGGSQSKARFATSDLGEVRGIVQQALRSPNAQFLPNPNVPRDI